MPKRPETWENFIKHPCTGDHIVQLYQSDDFLMKAATLFIESGLENDAVVAIATPGHREKFADVLESRGLEDLLKNGRFVSLDAADVLSQFIENGRPQWASFQRIAGQIIENAKQASPSGRVHVYGEMANLLWLEGDIESGVSLEGMWNDLARAHNFSLFCAFQIDNLDDRGQDALAEICRTHSHLVPFEDYGLFDQALGRAVLETLGESEAGMVRALVEWQGAAEMRAVMPESQAVMIWLQSYMPFSAQRVRALARKYLQNTSNPLKAFPK